MTLSHRRLLEHLLDTYDRTGAPVRVSTLAAELDVERSRVRDGIETLADCSLVAETPEGVRPTITARELLALNVDDDSVLIVDACEDE